MKVYGVQLDMVWEDKSTNFKKVEHLLAEAEVQPGALIVMPEMFATGYSMNVESVFEEDNGPTENFLADLAARYQSHVMGGVVKKAADGRGLNQAVIAAPTAEIALRYSKLHPFSYAGETKFYTAGNNLQLFDLPPFIFAPFVCYDLRFPEIFRDAVIKGSTVFVVIACWPAAREAHWLALLQARAIENCAYVVGINRCGKDPKLEYSGRSQIISPQGEILQDAGNDEGLISEELDPSYLNDYRANFPVLNDIRPEYKK